MNIVLSDPKERRAYSKKTEEAVFVGRQVGETVSLEPLGLKGYKAVISGGSDRDGFPMKASIGGQSRKKVFMTRGVGIRQKRKGERQRKRVRGNTVAPDIHQLNLKITQWGEEKLSKLFGKNEEAKEEKESTGKKGEKDMAPGKESGEKEKAPAGKAAEKETGKKQEEKPAKEKKSEASEKNKGEE